MLCKILIVIKASFSTQRRYRPITFNTHKITLANVRFFVFKRLVRAWVKFFFNNLQKSVSRRNRGRTRTSACPSSSSNFDPQFEAPSTRLRATTGSCASGSRHTAGADDDQVMDVTNFVLFDPAGLLFCTVQLFRVEFKSLWNKAPFVSFEFGWCLTGSWLDIGLLSPGFF